MTVQEIIKKRFRGETTIWFDYRDYVKANNGVDRKGLMYNSKYGKFDIYIVSEGGEEVLFDVLENSDGFKMDYILKMMEQ